MEVHLVPPPPSVSLMERRRLRSEMTQTVEASSLEDARGSGPPPHPNKVQSQTPNSTFFPSASPESIQRDDR